MKKNDKTIRYGGQALLEGVMMRGRLGMSVAVRHTSGEVLLETTRLKKPGKARKIPVLRGVIAFGSSLMTGTNTIMRSAELAGTEDEDEKIGKGWLIFATVLGLALGIGIFMLLPSFLTDLLAGWFNLESRVLIKSLIAGGIRIILFVSYLALVSLMKDIRRTFMYHGAEHRAISCHEKGLALNTANIQNCSTRHDRCGTTFLFIVIILSILVFAATSYLMKIAGLPTENKWLNMAVRLLLLPFVAGISYEALRGLACAGDNFVIKILKAPGLALQRLTTRLPDDGMAEVALVALEAAVLMDESPDLPAIGADKFYMKLLQNELERILPGGDAETIARRDRIIEYACNIKRAEIALTPVIDKKFCNTAIAFAKRCATGEPLSQVIGRTEFYGIEIKVSGDVLTPRPETELLAEQAVLLCKSGAEVLDLCTGSGCVAIAVFDQAHGKGININMIATDVSPAALAIAAQNVGARPIELREGDLFGAVEGQTFDIIVCNPPYIPSGEISELDAEVRDFEPRIALCGGDDGLDFYRQICSQAAQFLRGGGSLLLEAGAGQAQDVSALMKDAGFCEIRVIKDYAGIDRIITGKDGRAND